MSGIHRVIVGASGSPCSLQALRYAVEVARAHDATLMAVLAWVPPGGNLAEAKCGPFEPRDFWAGQAMQQLRDTLTAVSGDVALGLSIYPVVLRGDPGRILVNTACQAGDLLVIGAGHRRGLSRALAHDVSGYCLVHATCPVVAIPAPEFARHVRHGLLGRACWRRQLTPERVVRDPGTATG